MRALELGVQTLGLDLKLAERLDGLCGLVAVEGLLPRGAQVGELVGVVLRDDAHLDHVMHGLLDVVGLAQVELLVELVARLRRLVDGDVHVLELAVDLVVAVEGALGGEGGVVGFLGELADGLVRALGHGVPQLLVSRVRDLELAGEVLRPLLHEAHLERPGGYRVGVEPRGLVHFAQLRLRLLGRPLGGAQGGGELGGVAADADGETTVGVCHRAVTPRSIRLL